MIWQHLVRLPLATSLVNKCLTNGRDQSQTHWYIFESKPKKKICRDRNQNLLIFQEPKIYLNQNFIYKKKHKVCFNPFFAATFPFEIMKFFVEQPFLTSLTGNLSNVIIINQVTLHLLKSQKDETYDHRIIIKSKKKNILLNHIFSDITLP